MPIIYKIKCDVCEKIIETEYPIEVEGSYTEKMVVCSDTCKRKYYRRDNITKKIDYCQGCPLRKYRK